MELAVEKYKVANEPYYLPLKNEVELFEAAFAARLPAMLKGPTGCGKTRFVEYMAHRLDRPLSTAMDIAILVRALGNIEDAVALIEQFVNAKAAEQRLDAVAAGARP